MKKIYPDFIQAPLLSLPVLEYLNTFYHLELKLFLDIFVLYSSIFGFMEYNLYGLIENSLTIDYY
jgi:hypothetical protein